MDLFCEALIPVGGKKLMTNAFFGNKGSYLKQFKILTTEIWRTPRQRVSVGQVTGSVRHDRHEARTANKK